VVIVAASVWMVGCERFSFMPAEPQPPRAQQPAQPAATAEPPARDRGRADYMAASAVRGDDQTAGQGAVDIALEWSNKYAKSAEELLDCQKSNKELQEENKKLLAQISRLQMQSDQAQKDLQEANDMLVELGKELREWKGNVLGFRNEMQQAQQVQMDAIKRIMLLLGAEPAQPTTRPAEKPAASPRDASSDLSKAPS
jgi:peptidoglycan hydrolase CwlO-like protein